MNDQGVHMSVRTADIHGNPYIGVFCRLVGDTALIPQEASPEFVKLVRGTLGVRPVRSSLGGTNLHGSLIAANSKGMVAPYFFSKEEIEKAYKEADMVDFLEDYRIEISEDPMTSWGNNLLLSEGKALVNPDLKIETIRLVEEALDVEIVAGDLAEAKTPGSVACMNSKGMVVHPKSTEEERDQLSDLFGVDVQISTANFGSPYLGASILANDNGALIGNKSSGVEINRIESTLDLI